MDPIVTPLVLSAIGGTVGSLFLIWYKQRQLRLALEDIEEQRRRDAEWARIHEEQRLRHEESVRREEEKRRRQEERQKAEEAARPLVDVRGEIQKIQEAYSDPMFIEVARNVRLTKQQVLVGTRKSGERFLGVLESESVMPADSVDIRQIRDMTELPSVLASEWAMDEDMFDARLAAGEMLVQVPVLHTPLMEDVYEPVYKDVVHEVYVLLDVSPSMFPSHAPWRMPVWKGLTLRVLFDTIQATATFTLRPFCSRTHPSVRAVNEYQALQVAKLVLGKAEGSGTDIRRALEAAVEDFKGRTYDTADILIITDGEDEAELAKPLRRVLDERRIKLHAVMLGTKNESLRACCDSYQVLEPLDGGSIKVHPVVSRQVAGSGSPAKV